MPRGPSTERNRESERVGSGAREGVDLCSEVGVGGGQVGAGVVEGADEFGGVVVGKGRMKLAEGSASRGGQVGERGDLTGDAAQVGCVAAGPSGGGAFGGTAFAGGSDALFSGGSGGAGAAAQVAAFGGLAAGDAEGWARSAQLAPASRAVSISPVSHPASCSRTCRSSIREASACSGPWPGASGVAGVSRRASRRASSMACRAAAAARNDGGLWAFVLVVDGWSAAVTGTFLSLSSCRRHRVCHPLDDMLQRCQ